MGKGCGWRKGTNYKAYNDSDYWKGRDERVAKAKAEKEALANKELTKNAK